MTITTEPPRGGEADPEHVSVYAAGLGPDLLSGPVRVLCEAAVCLAASPPPTTGLGGTAAADVAQLAHLTRVLTTLLGAWIPAVEADGSLPYGTTTTLVQAGWSPPDARALRRAALFADRHPSVAKAWLRAEVSVDQVAALSRASLRLDPHQVPALVDSLVPLLPGLTSAQTTRLLDEAVEMLRPDDADAKENADYRDRYLSWTRPGRRDGLHVKAYLPAAEADAFLAAITATAEALRTQGDGVSIPQRRADALTALITSSSPTRSNGGGGEADAAPGGGGAGGGGEADAAPGGRVSCSLTLNQEEGEPARDVSAGRPATGGGLPVALTLTVSLTEADRLAARDPADRTPLPTGIPAPRIGPPVITGNGFRLSDSAARFGLCCAAITPVLHTTTSLHDPGQPPPEPGSLAARLAATRVEPLAVGRAVRLATSAQRKALALRDGGCVIPGCDIDVGHTQPHHVTPWSLGGRTDLDGLALLCWVHHRQVENGRFTLTHVRRLPTGADPDRPPPGTQRHSVWWITPRYRWEE